MLRPDSLPEPIATWFEANPKDVEAVARCFTNDAIVKDERHTHSGIEEIRRWKAATAAKYTYICEPFAVARQDGMTVVTSRLTGDLPGSPVDLRYFFRLERGKIAFLEIIP
jgi:ketosteroid isomerase-like protein